MSPSPVVPARIRVVLMIGTLVRGGAEGQLVMLATRLDRSRFDVRVCCLTGGGPLESDLLKARVPVDVIGWQGFPAFSGLGALAGALGLLRIAARLSAYFRRHRPHIVQGQLFWAYVLGALAAVPARVPVVIGCRRSLPIFKAGNPRHLWLERLANRFTTIIVANSEQVRLAAIATEHLPPDRVVTIHNGVDVPPEVARAASSDTRRGLGLRDNDLAVICVANLIAYKGHTELLDAWPAVRRACPAAWLLLVGEGPERAGIEARVRGLEGVRVLGARGDIPALLAVSTLFVQASRQEGLPNAVLEAMAAGLPVVATDVGGTAELVADGETGRLVPPMDAARLGRAVVAMLQDDNARARMGRAARAHVQARFSVAAMVSAYERLYERLVAGEHR